MYCVLFLKLLKDRSLHLFLADKKLWVIVQPASETKKSLCTLIKTYVLRAGTSDKPALGKQDVDGAKVLDVVKITALH